MSFYLDLFAFSLIDMSLWKKKNLKSIFQTYEIKDFSTLNQKLIIFHKIKIMWGWWFIHFTTFFFQFCCLVHIFLDILGQRLLSESLIKKPWLLLIVMFPPLSIYLVGFFYEKSLLIELWANSFRKNMNLSSSSIKQFAECVAFEAITRTVFK